MPRGTWSVASNIPSVPGRPFAFVAARAASGERRRGPLSTHAARPSRARRSRGHGPEVSTLIAASWTGPPNLAGPATGVSCRSMTYRSTARRSCGPRGSLRRPNNWDAPLIRRQRRHAPGGPAVWTRLSRAAVLTRRTGPSGLHGEEHGVQVLRHRRDRQRRVDIEDAGASVVFTPRRSRRSRGRPVDTSGASRRPTSTATRPASGRASGRAPGRAAAPPPPPRGRSAG